MPFPEIQSDPNICSNCFRRTHGVYERNYRLEVVQVENDEGKLKWTVEPVSVEGVEIEMADGTTEEIGGMDDDVFSHPDSVMEIPEKGALRGLRRICKCGFRYHPEREWKNRPLDKKTFFEYAERIADRMDEKGVNYDRAAFMDRLDELKSDPDEQFADDEMFKRAANHASSLATARNTANDPSASNRHDQ